MCPERQKISIPYHLFSMSETKSQSVIWIQIQKFEFKFGNVSKQYCTCLENEETHSIWANWKAEKIAGDLRESGFFPFSSCRLWWPLNWVSVSNRWLFHSITSEEPWSESWGLPLSLEDKKRPTPAKRQTCESAAEARVLPDKSLGLLWIPKGRHNFITLTKELIFWQNVKKYPQRGSYWCLPILWSFLFFSTGW